VPSWGRPLGAKGSKRRKQWERERELWQEQSRVEELDSDDTDTQGVGLNFEKKRFTSDPLQFTGIDLASTSRARRSYAYDSDDSEEDTEGSDEDENTSALQVALRDKEEALVQSALARIRRAQEKGKREVKLNPEELDALEKRRKRMQSAATTKERKGSGSSSGSEKRRRNDRDLVTLPLPAAEPKSRKKGKSKRSEDVSPYPLATVAPPGMLVQGADGVTYAPLGYYPQQAGPSRNSPTRPRSATSQQLRATPPPQLVAYQQGPSNRHFSDGNRPTSSSSNGSRRPLPDEEGWIPAHSRHNSISSQTHSVDPFEYQISSEQPPPIPQQYMQTGGRRNVSGPPEVIYSSVRRSPPIGSGYPAARGPASDPTLRRRSSRRDESSSEEEDESDDLGNGVQVFVEERDSERERERAVARKPVGSRKKGKGR
jgi:hypothetical protein